LAEQRLTLGRFETKSPTSNVKRMSMLLWGRSGCGKTVFASTAPREILWISFDPDGTDSLAGQDGIHVIDMSIEPDAAIVEFKKKDPLGLKKFLYEHPEVQTVVFDSLTTYGEKALTHGVAVAQGTPKGRTSTLEDPGFAGYGNKNTWTRILVSNLLRVTGEANRHMIFIAHEDKPEKNDQGQVMFISIMLGSSLNEQVPINISEVWGMEDTGKLRRIAIRPCRQRKPMKSRMFRTGKGYDPEFEVTYDAETGEGERISDFIDAWIANDGMKIDPPGHKGKDYAS